MPSKEPELTALIEKYASGLSHERKEEVFHALVGKFGGPLNRLSSHWRKNGDSIDAILGAVDEGSLSVNTALDIACNADDSYDSGLAMGFLFPNADIPQKKAKGGFPRGFRDGQIFGLKADDGTIPFVYLGLGLITSYLLLIKMGKLDHGPVIASQASYEVMKWSSRIGKIALGSGFFEMVRTGLLGNDAQKSEKLVTNGLFYFVRNPLYAGIMVMAASGLANETVMAYQSIAPNYLRIGLFAAGITVLGSAFYRRAVNDEAILEKTFGNEYVCYKKATNRFLPTLSKIPVIGRMLGK